MALIIKKLGLTSYEIIHQKMKIFTNYRKKNSIDELWLLQHKPVFTLGLSNTMTKEILKKKSNIPVVKSDRGGQITYHGPGQLIAYTLFDLKKLRINIRKLVIFLESAVINLLNKYNIDAYGMEAFPGVYIDGKKIASLGLKYKNGFIYHGIALNVDMDLSPFELIDPCGMNNLEITQMRDYEINDNIEIITNNLISEIKIIHNAFERE